MRRATRDNAVSPCKHRTTKVRLGNFGIDYRRRSWRYISSQYVHRWTSARARARKSGLFFAAPTKSGGEEEEEEERKGGLGTRRRRGRRRRRRRSRRVATRVSRDRLVALIRELADAGIHIACPREFGDIFIGISTHTVAKTRPCALGRSPALSSPKQPPVE